MINNDLNEKICYKNNLWLYLDDIKERFLENRRKLTRIIQIIKYKNNLEEKNCKEIKALCDDFISQYKSKEEIKTQTDIALDKIIYLIREENDIKEEKTKYIETNIIKSLNGIIDTQIRVSNEILGLVDSSTGDFKLINQLLREKEVLLMKIGQNLESSMYKLERAISAQKTEEKEKNEKKEEKEEKGEEKNQNLELIKDEIEKDNNNKTENKDNNNDIKNIEHQKEDLIEKYKKEKEQNLKKAKMILIEYENFIKIANDEREKYIKISSKIYSQFQQLDEDFIIQFKNIMKEWMEKEINFIKNDINLKETYLKNYLNLIDVQKDIEAFINSKKIKFTIPTEIRCLYYTPQIILKNINNPKESKITEKVNNELNSIFLKNKKKVQEKKLNESEIFIKRCIKLILEEKDYEKDSLLKMLENIDDRKIFFEALNQYRIEGIFELKQKTFDELSFLLNFIIKIAYIDEDYESLKTIIILSQTFYLGNKKDKSINSNISENEIWKDKIFWEKLIDYSINDELNNSKDFYIYLEEDAKSRKQRINSAITSSIVTFIFNMKLFNFPEDKCRELVSELIQKYNIDGTSIYSTLDSINNIIEIEKNKKQNINENCESEKDNNQNKEKVMADTNNKL